MHMLFRFAGILAIGLSTAFEANAAPARTPAECDAAAKVWFSSNYADGKKVLKSGRSVGASHQVHFNAKRKLCLVRVESNIPAHDKSPALANVAIHNLNAPNQKIIASLIRVRDKATHCVVEGKKCQSAEEWNKLTAPLMQD